jgi:serine/threonine protein kinase
MKGVAEGIEHAHDAGVLHCDLKPDNVRVTPRMQAKVLDFGLSRAKYLPAGPAVRLGTLPYMPPERIVDGELTVAGDIYSLGVTLFELVTGRRPFSGDDELSLMADILAPSARRSTTIRAAVIRRRGSSSPTSMRSCTPASGPGPRWRCACSWGSPSGWSR